MSSDCSVLMDKCDIRRYLKGGDESVSVSSGGIYHTVLVISLITMISAIILVSFICWRAYFYKETDGGGVLYAKSSSTTTHSLFGIFPWATQMVGIDIAEKEETMHLLSNASLYDKNEIDCPISTSDIIVNKASRSYMAVKRKSKYFNESNVRDGNDTMLMLAFTSVMSIGIFLNLHTTYGARTVCVTMVGDNVRWQAVKQTSSKVKRYKLNLVDVTSVESGKQSGHQDVFESVLLDERSIRSTPQEESVKFDDLCFSLVTQKTSLYLEAASKLDRDSLVRGFQLRLESLRN